DAEGVGEGVGAGGGRVPGRRPADPARPERALALAALDDADEDVGEVLRVRDQVVGEQGRLHVAVLDVHVLGERVAEALHGAALDLPLHPHRVDRPADVVACRVPQHPDLTGLDIDLYVGRVRAV